VLSRPIRFYEIRIIIHDYTVRFLVDRDEHIQWNVLHRLYCRLIIHEIFNFFSIKNESPCLQRSGLARYEELCDRYTKQ
jgi:hypothetical protein